MKILPYCAKCGRKKDDYFHYKKYSYFWKESFFSSINGHEFEPCRSDKEIAKLLIKIRDADDELAMMKLCAKHLEELRK